MADGHLTVAEWQALNDADRPLLHAEIVNAGELMGELNDLLLMAGRGFLSSRNLRDAVLAAIGKWAAR